MNNSLNPFPVLLIAALVLAVGGCQACPKVDKPDSDSTPPVITWKVRNDVTNAVQNFPTNATMQAKYGEKYVVTMIVSDNGGVHKTSLGKTDWFGCKNGDLFKEGGSSADSTKEETHKQWPNGQVCSEVKMYEDLTLVFNCQQPGFQFSSGLIHLTGVGENFFGGATTAKLDINIAP